MRLLPPCIPTPIRQTHHNVNTNRTIEHYLAHNQRKKKNSKIVTENSGFLREDTLPRIPLGLDSNKRSSVPIETLFGTGVSLLRAICQDVKVLIR
jgi:hypothetical protein